MYHSKFKGNPYEAGYKWGALLRKNNNFIETHMPKATQERALFAQKCMSDYKTYYPEILEEIKGIADGQCLPFETLSTFLFSMYCFEFQNRCTCFVFRDDNEIVFGRNSDFLVDLEKLCDSCYYALNGAYHFVGTTTAMVQMEDGVNEYGLAVGLTFVYPNIRKAGLNAGMLVRYLLEKCKTVQEAVNTLQELPIASAQAITLADATGDMAVVECNPEKTVVIKTQKPFSFVVSSNNFYSHEMEAYKNPPIDDWRADERYAVVSGALKNNVSNYSTDFAKNLLAGKYGFMCQYDRKTNADTVWSVVYDLRRKMVFRAEGNPSRKKYVEDKRLRFCGE